MRNKLIGFGLLLSVVVLWVGSSTAIQKIFKEIDFYKPYFLTYFSTSWFSLYLVTIPFKKQANLKYISQKALRFCPLWFFANYFFNLSLGLTSVASNTILSSTSSGFTLVLSVLLLKEPPEFLKFISVGVALGGVVCVALADEQEGEDSLTGDLLALAGALVYALYSVYLKSQTRDLDMILFFGFVGLWNILILLPGFLVVDLVGLETFELPGLIAFVALLCNALFGTVLSDLLWAFSVRLLNPALCTVALSLTIPLSMSVDYFLHNSQFSVLYFSGTGLILLGFVVMSLFESERLSILLSNKSIFRKMLGKKNSSEILRQS